MMSYGKLNALPQCSKQKQTLQKGSFLYTMKGFGIYVKNNLLETKHVVNMGEAVWLYLWLLDRMTSINENGVGKVLGSQPIKYEMVFADLGVTLRTYRRWLEKLRVAGYVNTLRTPYGLVVTVNKAEKIYQKRSDKNGTSNTDVPHMSHPDVPKIVRDVPKIVPRSDKNGTSNKTIQDNTKDNTSITNVIGSEKPSFGKPEINEMFGYWEKTIGYPLKSRVTSNRRACSNLLKRYSALELKKLVDLVHMAHQDSYAGAAGKISDFADLQSSESKLKVWLKTKASEQVRPRAVKI